MSKNLPQFSAGSFRSGLYIRNQDNFVLVIYDVNNLKSPDMYPMNFIPKLFDTDRSWVC